MLTYSKVLSFLLSGILYLTLGAQVVFAQSINMAEQIKTLTTTKSFLRAGSALFETDDLAKFYALRNNQPVWTENGAVTPFAAALKQAIIDLSAKHGLVAADYWTNELENYYEGLNEKIAIAFELAATESYLLLGMNLANGRIDPTYIDDDVRFKKRIFVDHRVMAQAVSATPGMMADIVETLAPQHIFYKNTLSILAQLRQVKSSGGFMRMRKPNVKIEVGTKNSVISFLRERLRQQGYQLTGTGNIYDEELSLAVQEMQKEYGFEVSATLKPDSGIWGVLAVSVDQRISQTEATLEKLRWLPKQLEPNMIFVNTNATELKVFENNQVINQFKSINGRALRRTPMMKTYITRVIFNPRWIATDSIVLQDKLPEIIKDPTFLARIRMRIFNRVTGQVVDPTTLDWVHDGRKIARQNLFVMDPGPKNALGTFKFPLAPDLRYPNVSNKDDIFMHFTDNPDLFNKPNARHLSSGCIRIEKAQWLAGYLLKNVPGYDETSIENLIAKGIDGEIFQTDKIVPLPEADYRAVYTVPLTVEMTASGKPRFMKDVYLHDRRIGAAVLSKNVRGEANQSTLLTAPGAVATGLKVIGQAGVTQQFGQVVAVKCDEPQWTENSRTYISMINRQCDKAVTFDLNTAQELPTGKYLVGFENSIYPGFVEIHQGEIVTIQLQKIAVPTSFSKENSIKIYRDFTSLTEQKKVYFEKFYLGKSIFRQTARKFGDFYLAGLTDIDLASQSNYSYCSDNRIEKLKLAIDIREQAKFVCESYNNAKSMMDYADLYRFDPKGSYQEASAEAPGDIFPKKMLRHLVATPMKSSDFVSVMPGVYRIIGSSGRTDSRVTTLNLVENYPNLSRSFTNSRNKGEEDDIDLPTTMASSEQIANITRGNAVGNCSSAVMWRTEKRSYCTTDAADGCNRSLAQECSEMNLDLRFRK